MFILEGKGRRKRGRETSICLYVVAFRVAPTGDLACNLGMCPDWGLNWRPFGLQPALNPLSYTSQGYIFVIKKGTSNFYFIKKFSHISHFISMSHNIILREPKRCRLLIPPELILRSSPLRQWSHCTWILDWVTNGICVCLSCRQVDSVRRHTLHQSPLHAPGNWDSVLDVRDDQYVFVEQIIFVKNIILKFVICLLSYSFKQMNNYIYVAILNNYILWSILPL